MSLLSKMQLAAMSDIDTRIVYICRQGRESPDANFSRIRVWVTAIPVHEKRVTCMYNIHRTSPVEYMYSEYAARDMRPPVSPVRFLSERSSDGYTSGATHELLRFVPTPSFWYFLPSGIYIGKIAAANIWQCVPGHRGELCVKLEARKGIRATGCVLDTSMGPKYAVRN